MSRVTSAFLKQFTPLSINDVNNGIVMVVDMINGFVKEGALHDKAILDIVPSICKLLAKREMRAIFLQDAHPPRTREFDAFPQHCQIGSSESKVIDELVPYIDELIPKNSTNAFHAPGMQEFINERLDNYEDIIIVGCCSDICVLQFALTLQAYLNEHNMKDKHIIVPISMIETYHIDNIHDAISYNEIAISIMKQSGINIVSDIKGEQ